MPTPVVRDGEHVFLEPLTDAGTVEFGEPVGAAPTIYTIHSEQATFADSFGARDVSFQLSLNPAFLEKIRLLTDLGLAGTDPVDVRGTPVVPRQLLLALLARLPKASPSHEAFGIHRVEVYGENGTAVIECVTRSVDRLEFGGGVLSTACPPAVVADMICRGEIDRHGVLPVGTGGAVPRAVRAARALRRDRPRRGVAAVSPRAAPVARAPAALVQSSSFLTPSSFLRISPTSAACDLTASASACTLSTSALASASMSAPAVAAACARGGRPCARSRWRMPCVPGDAATCARAANHRRACVPPGSSWQPRFQLGGPCQRRSSRTPRCGSSRPRPASRPARRSARQPHLSGAYLTFRSLDVRPLYRTNDWRTL